MIRGFLLTAALLGIPAFAQQAMFSGETGVISQVVDGDGWQTSISLNNIDAKASLFKLSFFADNGTPMVLSTNFGSLSVIYGTIPARGSVNIITAGASASLSQGWGKMETDFQQPGTSNFISGATIAGTVLFLRPQTASRPTEASEPLDFSLESQWVLPFDHTNGYSTGVALVNQESFADLSVFVTIFDQNGNQIALDSFTLPRNQHSAFTVTQKYPQTVGLKGTVRIQTSGIAINVLGLRFTPNGQVSGVSPTSWF